LGELVFLIDFHFLKGKIRITCDINMKKSQILLKESKKDIILTQRDLDRQLKEFRKKFKKKRQPKTTTLYWYMRIGYLVIFLSIMILIYIFYDFISLQFGSIREFLINLKEILFNLLSPE